MQIVQMPIEELLPYQNNPRKNEHAVSAVAASIREFGFKVPIIVDKNNVIVAGHTRLAAAQELGMREVPCIIADDLTDEQIRAFRLADNKTAELAEWDMELLDLELLDIDMDMEQFGFQFESDTERMGTPPNDKNLQERFGAPPFSILDTRKGYWQDRKRQWKSIGIKSEVGRDDALLGSGLKELAQKTNAKDLTGTSIFDPVLTELMYLWYCPEEGKIIDPFAGGSVRGVVAAKLGREYTGIDLSQRQIDANNENADEIGVSVTWYCDDSTNLDKYVEAESQDMVFSCPPYADLEVYSNDPRDISNMDYEHFLAAYRTIIFKAVTALKDDRFAIFVVGDVRDEKGFYRDFISDTKRAFIDAGMKLYNEIILIESGAAANLRAARVFQGFRKTVKVHQNVLVFYKGNPKAIKDNFAEVEIMNMEEEQEEE